MEIQSNPKRAALIVANRMCMFGAIPQDLINRILILLPVKSFLRFKCVNKSFCSTLGSRHLVDSRSSRNEISRKLVELRDVGENIHAYEFTDDFRRELVLVEPVSPSLADLSYSYCNGLVLLHTLQDKDSFSLWNPSTREYRELPDLPLERHRVSDFAFGLGYDSTMDDYKAVVIWCSSQVWMFSLRSGCWSRIADFPFPESIGGNRDCFVDGALHFACCRDEDGPDYSIASFDVAKETFSQVEKPDCAPFRDDALDLHVIGGCLAVSLFIDRENGGHINQIDTYIGNKAGDEFTWTKLYSVTVEQFGDKVFWAFRNARHAYSKEGDKVFFEVDGKLFWYDHKTEQLQDTEIEMDNHLDMLFCTESLVSIGLKSSLTNKRKFEAFESKSNIEEDEEECYLT